MIDNKYLCIVNDYLLAMEIPATLYSIASDSNSMLFKADFELNQQGSYTIELIVDKDTCAVVFHSSLRAVPKDLAGMMLIICNDLQRKMHLCRLYLDNNNNLSADYTMVLAGDLEAMVKVLNRCFVTFRREVEQALGVTKQMLG